jgi:uncharacterized protein YodC (DUF2158 family)
MNEIKPGSIVMLKSGGPQMTVRWIDDNEAYCEWFTDVKNNPENKGATFVLASLQLIAS